MIEYTYIDNILRLKSDAPISPSSHVTVRREDSDKITATVYRLGRLLKAEQSGGYYYRWYGAAPESVTTDNGPALARQLRELPSSEEAKAAMALARAMLPTVVLTADQTIAVSALCAPWAEGAYQPGDIRLAEYGGAAQPWKCRQGHNTWEHPDIRPDGAAWRTPPRTTRGPGRRRKLTQRWCKHGGMYQRPQRLPGQQPGGIPGKAV